MKLPKDTKRYCPTCNKSTKQTISAAKQRSRSSAHPMSRSSNARLIARGLRSGYGNKGKYSKPAIKSWKRKSKQTKRISVLYTCTICKKARNIKKAIRTSRLEIGDKVAK